MSKGLQRFFGFVIIVTFIVVTVLGGGDSFPEMEGERSVSFDWDGYSLDMKLHDSVYEYYRERSKEYVCTGPCPDNWESEYYSNFLDIPEEDDSISRLVSKIGGVGDERLDRALALVQSISYDQEMADAEKILPRFPYEVLYDQKGVCSGKSFLGALIAKELGYGTALLVYEEANHMALGVKCPSGYCFMELTTPGWKVGIQDFDDIEDIKTTTPSLDEAPEIYKVSDGREYMKATENLQEKERVKSLKIEIEQKEMEIEGLEDDMDYYKRTKNYSAYNNLVPLHNDMIVNYRSKVRTYNRLIEELTPG